MLKHRKETKIVWMYVICAILVELVGVYVVDQTILIQNPILSIGLLCIMSLILLMIKRPMMRYVIGVMLLLIQILLNLTMIVIYDMTGTYFDYGMFHLRNDAFGILESIPMNYLAFFCSMVLFVLFFIYAKKFVPKNQEESQSYSVSYILYGGLIGILSFIMAFMIVVTNKQTDDVYIKELYENEGGKYAQFGFSGNFLNEVCKGLFFNSVNKMDQTEVDNFLYEEVMEQSKHFSVSEGNNVITILAETFEWYAFMRNESFPNELDLTDEQLAYLYPNLTKFYEESVKVTNFHSREKTDIAESLSIIGNYPTEAYINYDFPTNEIPYSIPNLLKVIEGEDGIYTRSFHNGFKEFYNRLETHQTFGFDSLTDCYDMIDQAKEQYQSGKTDNITMYDYLSEGERNLDSEMIKTCKNEMFPTDKRFYTYITTITMHGMYYERENLATWNQKIDELKDWDESDDMQMKLKNYMSTAMEFDHAVGVMMEELEQKGLLDHTTIVIFGDHNAYYQGLSKYVKDIESYDTKQNYPDLYKVPMMIYDQNLKPEIIDKFTCTADIVPTILDLLGINTYENMYYGNSVFLEEESVLYSRAYDVYFNDQIYVRNLQDILFERPDMTAKEKEEFEKKVVALTEEIKYCDQIFYHNYFGDSKNYQTFLTKMKEINPFF